MCVDKSDAEGGGLAIFCSCWDALWGIKRKLTSYNCYVYPYCLTQELEGSMDGLHLRYLHIL